MALNYLLTALILAVTLNSANRWLRAGGTLLAASGLAMIALSIGLANTDGTFARMPASDAAWRPLTPFMLNAQALVAGVAALFLGWAAWAQSRRTVTTPLPAANTADRFGRISRYAHWTTAMLVLVAVPIGLFVTVLAPIAPERAEFLAAHQSLGLVVLLVVAARLAWLAISPPPPLADSSPGEARNARALHLGLYALVLLFPLSGLMMALAAGVPVAFFGFPIDVPAIGTASTWQTLHGLILPLAFYAAIAVHVGAVAKHHFADSDPRAIRRMLR